MADHAGTLTDADKLHHIQEELEHQDTVRAGLAMAASILVVRAITHDRSKIAEPEITGFTQLKNDHDLSTYPYASEEYRAALRQHKPVIQDHYAKNDHHPEHFPNGIAGMSLMALIEMLADWDAAKDRSPGGNLLDSILKNADRFGYDAVITQILINTAVELGMLPARLRGRFSGLDIKVNSEQVFYAENTELMRRQGPDVADDPDAR